jgi:hypothetical protein
MKKWLLLGAFAALFATQSQAQCLLYEIPLTEKLEKSQAVIEGEVLRKRAFWDDNHNMIFTEYYIGVSSILNEKKPTTMPLSSLVIQVEGGQVGDEVIEVEPSLHLNIGDKGIFCINQKKTKAYYRPVYEVYADVQGFIRYEESTNTAIDVFAQYNIHKLKQNIEAYTHFSPQILHSLAFIQNESSRGPSISSFSPTTLSVGTGAVLTITGTGFGTQTGSAKVQFTDPDYSSTTYSDVLAADYVSWTNTEIKINMNSGSSAAGTGKIKVFDAAGANVTSSTNLTVTFQHGKGELGNDNGIGGYTFQFNSTFAQNAAALAAVKRAMETWRCTSGVNFGVGTTTTAIDTNLTTDNVNVIRWGILPSGTLGKCYWSYSICTGYNPKKDIDITFSKTAGVNWNYGPAATTSGKSDLESVALHELGHGLGLGHVSNLGNSMFPVLTNGTDVRTPNATGDVLGAAYVMNISTTAATCSGISKMIALTANNCHFINVGIQDEMISPISILPNPNQGSFRLNMENILEGKIEIWNMMGQKIQEVDFQGNDSQEIEMGNASSGVYLLKVIATGKVWEKKFVVE